jgi:hypothetical protein
MFHIQPFWPSNSDCNFGLHSISILLNVRFHCIPHFTAFLSKLFSFDVVRFTLDDPQPIHRNRLSFLSVYR